MKTYRVALLGCGPRGTSASRGYNALSRTEVVALCDINQERLNLLGDELDVSARYEDLDAMIQETEPDIVIIPTNTKFHFELAMRVLEYGVNIDMEKPMCVDLEQADAVIARAKEKGARIAIHHQGRVAPAMNAVAKAFAEGRIGRLRHIETSGKGYFGGYGLMNIGTHSLSNVIKFAGHCQSVSATVLTGGHPITPADVVPAPNGMGPVAGECITATMTFKNNLCATLYQHQFEKMDTTAYQLRLLGSEGQLCWKMNRAWLLPTPHYLPDGEHDLWQELDVKLPEGFESGTTVGEAEYAFAAEYVAALDEDRDHECSGSEAHHVLEIMMGIFESGAHQRAIQLPQLERRHPLLRWREENGLGPPEKD
ncbi:MAG: Gfo/Idh/MocA family oxidoreductase [Planctomycetota bacterium]|nr:Gfo/Idh/MocA family oxidoreductase [Planctomycetota bacterium]